MSIGLVVAHPDDETLGMGGTLALLAKEHTIHLLVLADGETSRTAATEADVQQRCTKAAKSAELLGIASLHFMRLPDQSLDHMRLLDVIQPIENWLTRIGPGVVYTHHSGDLNADHRIVAQAVLTATRPTPGQTVREVYSFETPSSTEWAFGELGRTFQPNCFVDIAETMETKLKALACYESEMRAYPHPRSLEAIKVRAQYWGQVAGVHYAEAFQLIRGLM